jgi:hypothetical protein
MPSDLIFVLEKDTPIHEIDTPSEDGAKFILHVEILKVRIGLAPLWIEEHIDVAAWSEVRAKNGAEQAQLTDAVLLAEGPQGSLVGLGAKVGSLRARQGCHRLAPACDYHRAPVLNLVESGKQVLS